MNELKENLEYYIANQDDLVSRFNGRTILIHNQRVIGDYNDFMEGYFVAQSKGYESGSFSLILCSPGEDGFSVNRRTINRFSRMVCA
ncbi:MAG: hypothetical protein LBV80_09695 [Deltaproteobacteria bacterium]|jgi:hypothetical protein|nr:hypothetical protein [Deltaproteobacteria bacterium]